MKEQIKKMFEHHPAIDELYVTSDVQGFTNEDSADGHAGVLSDKKVLHCKRADYLVTENVADIEVEAEEVTEEKTKNNNAKKQ